MRCGLLLICMVIRLKCYGADDPYWHSESSELWVKVTVIGYTIRKMSNAIRAVIGTVVLVDNCIGICVGRCTQP